GAGWNTPVFITVEQLESTTDALGRIVSVGNVLANGAKTTVTLYTSAIDPSTQATETHEPIVSAVPEVTKPFGQIASAGIPVSAGNPFTQNPFTQNPFSQNPFTQNPFTQNPFAQNAAVGTIYDVTDISFTVTNGGNQAAAFTTLLNVQNALRLQGSYL